MNLRPCLLVTALLAGYATLEPEEWSSPPPDCPPYHVAPCRAEHQACFEGPLCRKQVWEIPVGCFPA